MPAATSAIGADAAAPVAVVVIPAVTATAATVVRPAMAAAVMLTTACPMARRPNAARCTTHSARKLAQAMPPVPMRIAVRRGRRVIAARLGRKVTVALLAPRVIAVRRALMASVVPRVPKATVARPAPRVVIAVRLGRKVTVDPRGLKAVTAVLPARAVAVVAGAISAPPARHSP